MIDPDELPTSVVERSGDNVKEAVSRGSQWHRWEPHIHAPGTVQADQYREDDAWELYLQALEAASPSLRAIGITDYCITRSYERLKAEKDNGRLSMCDLLFPNIELRLNTGTVKGNFVNIHLLVSPEDPNHIEELNRFLRHLLFPAFNDKFSCTPADLIRLGRKADPTKTADEAALQHGCSQFKVSLDNLREAYRSIEWARDNILIAVAGNADGSSGVKEAADATLREEIEKIAHAVFASSPKQRDFWLGHGKATVSELRERYGGQKPCLWGCDAHQIARVAKPAEDRLCWIKGAPTFDALRQAYIDPERAYVGATPPSWAAASQVIDELIIEDAPWVETPRLKLNPGLVAIIGARGSGKTALADMIAAGCDAYTESGDRPSFLARAREYLSGARVTLKWLSGGDPVTRNLDSPVNWSPDVYPRARYLSQQFVEELCSIEGMPTLIREVERVIFEAHPSIDRDGAVDFDELLQLRASSYRDARHREERALANISDQIGGEMEKTKQVATLKAQIAEKEKLIARYQGDQKSLLPKETTKTGERLQTLMTAADKVRGYVRFFANQQASLVSLKGEVDDLRQNRAPETLRTMKERHGATKLDAADWDRFLLNYSGDVDTTVITKARDVDARAKLWKGTSPLVPVDDSGAFLSDSADPEMTPLAVLEAEIGRLEKLVAADRDTATKLAAISRRMGEEMAALERLKERLTDCEGAGARAAALVAEREQGYIRVFDALLGEERVLNELYAPLMERLKVSGGTLAKLSFSVSRVADVAHWADFGEKDLFDLRGGPFKGIGSLAKAATSVLREAWQTGDSAAVSTAMTTFRDTYQDVLLEKAPFPRTDQTNYRSWSRRFAKWLYSTNHISIEYGIKYDGIDLKKLSPGTRGIVLVLLYLALDDADDKPLIIDQPEENLDPKSIYDELVPLFHASKKKRQVIMVTHNANLVINTDADQVIIADVGAHTAEGLPPIRYHSGGLEEGPIRQIVCDILEGGEIAFRDRARRLRIALDR
jgi:energy-coupling factor transporter ATP-binding protein EcfA2